MLMIVIGFAQPLYQVGADAMLADLIPPEKRTQGLRHQPHCGQRGVRHGPRGGRLPGIQILPSRLLRRDIRFPGLQPTALHSRPRNPQPERRFVPSPGSVPPVGTQGYGRVFRDRSYIAFAGLTGLGLIAPTMLWILLPIYAKSNFGLPESLYGWIPTTNAVMCVFLQFPVTEITRRYRALRVTATGMLVYALGAGSVALMTGFWGFWLSMVVLTMGELILVPTSSKYVADLAPADMRGRYMSIYWLSWGMARTLAPLIGGLLNDRLGGQAIWLGGLTLGAISTVGLFVLSRRRTDRIAQRISRIANFPAGSQLTAYPASNLSSRCLTSGHSAERML